ncbi:MAG: hypothetical protein LQ347_002552 [Umbilicaria vellea]|nr:MAG: hypothetical protein LQ347_002552 [Umbilicaria vellea]
MEIDYDQNDATFDTSSFVLCEEAKEAKESGDEILVEQAEALGVQFDYDGSVLTPEQRRALIEKYWAMHCEIFELRSPQYYEGKSQCLSVSETAWPGAVAMLKAEKLKQGYVEPEELIARLRMLKPSDIFELRKFRHPLMSWKSPTPLEEEGFERLPPDPDWLLDQLYAVTHMERRLGGQLTDQYRREIKDRQIRRGIDAFARLALIEGYGAQSGRTLFPRYLVKGLMTLRHHADTQGNKLYDEEYDSATVKREKAINRWKERNPDSMLQDDPLSIYRTWPADLVDDLDEIDREAIRCGRRKYVALLREAVEKMQALVAFWKNCGLVTGQRTPPSSWWQDPKAKVKRLPKPQYLNNGLDAIKTAFGYFTDKGEKLRMIETSRWIESMISGDSDPTAADIPLPPSLLDELDIVWRDRDWLDHDNTEDKMIARIRRWRNSKHQQRLEQGLRTSPQLGSDIGPEEPVQKARSPLWENLSRGEHAQPRMEIAMPEDQAIWRGRLRPRTRIDGQTSWRERLRPRSDAVTALHERTKVTRIRTGKPNGIVKRRKASKKKRPVPTEGQATSSITQKANQLYQASAQYHSNESSSMSSSMRDGSVVEGIAVEKIRIL